MDYRELREISIYMDDLGSKGWRRMWKLAVVGTQLLPLRLAGKFAKSYYGRQILLAGTGTD